MEDLLFKQEGSLVEIRKITNEKYRMDVGQDVLPTHGLDEILLYNLNFSYLAQCVWSQVQTQETSDIFCLD